jgi:uncharacterized protein YukJ
VGGEPMVNRQDMSLLPLPTHNPQDQLKNEVIALLNAAVADPGGVMYAFGSSFGDPDGLRGVDNIHMNQGNPPGQFEGDNGTWRDGGLLVNLPAANTWKALFIAFQSQSWRTDDGGDPLAQ